MKGINASGRSPAALTLEKARELGVTGRHMLVFPSRQDLEDEEPRLIIWNN